MAIIGFHASHEQWAPSELLRFAGQAEKGGFQAAMCSDHFHPWSVRQGQSGYAWSWLGAALEATNLSFGTVCAPGQRYHPAIIAQGAATLAEMYPGRLWLAVGSGEALNEAITSEPWPPKLERNSRLKEGVDIIRALWAGETVTHRGHVNVREATLFTRPSKTPLLIGAALTEETAYWMGSWADGLITAGTSHSGLRRVVESFRSGGGDGKPLLLQSAVSYAATTQEALSAAHDQWRHAALDADKFSNLATAEEFDAAAAHISQQDLVSKLRISADISEHLDWISRDAELGFDTIYLHNVGRNVEEFISDIGPRLADI
jgi:coenzyme F420-dependent glucose-6-phosphate dehydrogenase